MSSQLGQIKDEIVLKARSEVNNSIPPAWRLAWEQLSLPEGASVIDVPRTCGLLTPKQIEITEAAATELLSKISVGELSSSEVTEAFCIRAAITHQMTNCLTAFFPDEGLQTAAALDQHFRTTGKTVGPLHGLPVCIKDMYDLKGRRSTMAYISWFDVVASADSALVAILRDAGAIFYSKTTMPQTGMMLETRSPLWGVTTNPFNNQLVSGGSSGGDGVLVAMRGSPIAPSSDIGGSIRAPAAFNGLYSIRPSADRIPKGGLRSTVPGNVSIKVSSGPVCHNIVDLKMFTKIINAHGSLAHFEPGIVPMPWRELPPPVRKLNFGVWTFDGVCMPHPPILRAIKETTLRLTGHGHEVIPVTMPFDCWEIALVTWKLYFQTGFKEGKAALATGGEEIAAAMQFYLETFDIKALSIWELFDCNVKQASFKRKMAEWWNSTSTMVNTGLPIDGLICPVHPSTSYPHNFPSWWGYTSLWNVLDYPSTTMPVKGLKISADTDPKSMNYKPLPNPFDERTHAMYDPELFANQPVCIQIVGRPFQDEELISVTEVIDQVVNADN